jgi:hypothetical protein
LSVAEDSSFPRGYGVPTEKKIFTDISNDRPGLKIPVNEDTKTVQTSATIYQTTIGNILEDLNIQTINN